MRPAEVAAPIRDTREAGAQKCPEQTGAKDAKMKVVTFYAIGLRMPNRRGDAGGEAGCELEEVSSMGFAFQR